MASHIGRRKFLDTLGGAAAWAACGPRAAADNWNRGGRRLLWRAASAIDSSRRLRKKALMAS
jgi:hypothetical protein